MNAKIALQDFQSPNTHKALPNRQPTAISHTATQVITTVHRRIDTGFPLGPNIYLFSTLTHRFNTMRSTATATTGSRSIPLLTATSSPALPPTRAMLAPRLPATTSLTCTTLGTSPRSRRIDTKISVKIKHTTIILRTNCLPHYHMDRKSAAILPQAKEAAFHIIPHTIT